MKIARIVKTVKTVVARGYNYEVTLDGDGRAVRVRIYDEDGGNQALHAEADMILVAAAVLAQVADKPRSACADHGAYDGYGPCAPCDEARRVRSASGPPRVADLVFGTKVGDDALRDVTPIGDAMQRDFALAAKLLNSTATPADETEARKRVVDLADAESDHVG